MQKNALNPSHVSNIQKNPHSSSWGKIKKTIIFYCFIKGILKGNNLLFFRVRSTIKTNHALGRFVNTLVSYTKVPWITLLDIHTLRPSSAHRLNIRFQKIICCNHLVLFRLLPDIYIKNYVQWFVGVDNRFQPHLVTYFFVDPIPQVR